MSLFFKAAAAMTLAAMGLTVPAQAEANACWGAEAASAAHVRQLQTMLMVATLRCHAAGIDMATDYDQFVAAQREAITHANLVIRRHFGEGEGGTAEYDRFTTSLANGYGDDATTAESCAAALALAHDGAAAAPAALDGLASARATLAALPGGDCGGAPVKPAVAPLAPAPLLALAAPAPVQEGPKPVALPADVLAALTVLARFQAGPAAPVTPAPVTQVAAAAAPKPVVQLVP
jgi:hypothetical protein